MPQKNRWTRLVDSAQRRIIIEHPRLASGLALFQVRFEIQGVFIKQDRREEKIPYYEMHDRGVELDLCDKLSVWDRLRRQPAAAGTQREAEDKAVMTLWTPKPFLQLVFKLDDDDEAVLYQECRYMVLSAGYFLKKLD
jgi:hypothetical protein